MEILDTNHSRTLALSPLDLDFDPEALAAAAEERGCSLDALGLLLGIHEVLFWLGTPAAEYGFHEDQPVLMFRFTTTETGEAAEALTIRVTPDSVRFVFNTFLAGERIAYLYRYDLQVVTTLVDALLEEEFWFSAISPFEMISHRRPIPLGAARTITVQAMNEMPTITAALLLTAPPLPGEVARDTIARIAWIQDAERDENGRLIQMVPGVEAGEA